jgi:hypothetical protein
MIRIPLLDLDSFQSRGCEVYLQNVPLPRLHLRRNIKTMRDEHVVTLEDGLSVELNGRECIQAIESQHVSHASLLFRYLRQFQFVRPCFICNPFCFELIEAEEGINNPVKCVSCDQIIPSGSQVNTYLPLSIKSKWTLVGTLLTGIQASLEVSSDCLNVHPSVNWLTVRPCAFAMVDVV